MTKGRLASRRRRWTTAVVLGQLLICAGLATTQLDGAPHRVPVVVSGPPIVASALADQANALAGEPLHATATSSEERARADVRGGRAVAALVVDLRLNRATLLVSTAQGQGLTEAVAASARRLAEPYSATVATVDVAPVPRGSSGQGALLLVVMTAVIAGLVIAIGLTAHRGPVTETWPQARRRMATSVAAAGVVSGGVAVIAATAVGGSLVGWWALLLLSIVAVTAATQALEGVVGVAGIGVATAVLVVDAAPLVRIGQTVMLPDPWRTVTPWLPHGASLDAGRRIAWFGGTAVARPLLVLAAWVLVSCVVLAVARRERRRAGVVWSQGAATARDPQERYVTTRERRRRRPPVPRRPSRPSPPGP